jgi:acyl carrier protein|tara:strand:+ start:2279 stop:2533 length:255 start_codon:yes stop_codon:yes gene_type:complete
MKRIKAILSRVLEINEDEIIGETSPDTVESWDSFNGLMLISELESKFNVKFTMDEVTSAKCVNDIKNSLIKHGVIIKENDRHRE